MANAPVPGKPKTSGAPAQAPEQTIPITGTGPDAAKGMEGHPAQGPMTPPPASHGSTAPIEKGPSVDYDTQQGSRIPADILHHPNAVVPMGEQDQRT